ncbi:MAG: hypothetical protein RIQ41_90 [Candidatus Parcubacteria bacterium]|jgi:hypothetical protein
MHIHSNLTKEQAIKAKPENNCPEEVLAAQELVSVTYFNFDGVECQGQIVVHKDVAEDVRKVFEYIHESKFPVAKVVPIADPKYSWDDEVSCEDNNSSAFNYRMMTQVAKLSNHALGRAVDINPQENPFIRLEEDGVSEMYTVPSNGTYDLTVPGTLHKDHEVVKLFKSLGWKWGGDWNPLEGTVDYQHFEKLL